jgi:hypothetical protein
MLLDSKVFSKVSFITHNYLRTVNDIYAVVEKRGELFGILSDYLGE